MKTEIIYDMPAAIYHAIPAISSTGIKTFAKSPAHEKDRRDNPKPTTDVMLLGSVTHSATWGLAANPPKHDTMEQFVVAVECCTIKKGDGVKCSNQGTYVTDDGFWFCRTKGHAPASAHPPKTPPITVDILNKAKACARAVFKHYDARKILNSPTVKFEVSMFWTETVTLDIRGARSVVDIPCKARLDIYDPSFASWGESIADVKTCQSSYLPDFEDDIAERRYDLQTAWYLRGAMMASGGVEHKWFTFLPVQTVAPHIAACFRARPEMIKYAHDEIFNPGGFLESIAYCEALDFWPAYPGHERILVCNLPAWYHRNEERERKRDNRL